MKIQKNIQSRLVLTAFLVVLVVPAFMSTSIFAQTDANKTGPKITGNAPSQTGEDEGSKTWREYQSKKNAKPLTPATPAVSAAAAPKRRTRSDNLYAANNSSYRGLDAMVSFTNQDMTSDAWLRDRACGPAAIASAMWAAGLKRTYNFDQVKFAHEVMRKAPPKITLGGWVPINALVGMDWRQFNYGLDQYKSAGIKYAWVKGLADIKTQLAAGRPVAIMIDLGALPRGKYSMQSGAHWVVAFGYDSKTLYVTNFDGYNLALADLSDAWGLSGNPFTGVYAKGSGTAGMGVVVYK